MIIKSPVFTMGLFIVLIVQFNNAKDLVRQIVE